MIILADDPAQSTWIFAAALAVALLIGARRRAPNEPLFPRDVTLELKGAAILAVFCAHVGYLLVADHRFLFPLSVAAGLGVNVFLMLAGYGLTASALSAPRAAGAFCRRHLPKLYAPMWASLAFFLTLDYLWLGRARGFGEIARAALGYFPTADAFADLNSPLWYFTFIVGSYLLFPLIFSARRPWATATVYAALDYGLAAWAPAALGGVIGLYASHYLAFPTGILAAWVLADNSPAARFTLRLRSRATGPWLAAALVALLAWAEIYASGVGTDHEQIVSVTLALAAVAAFLLKPWRLPALAFLGTFSYEIYLLHWPLLARYGWLYGSLPGWLATISYLALAVGLGAGLKKISERRANR